MADSEYDPSIIEDVHRLCPCRKQQIEKLIELFGERDEFSSPNIFVHGNTGTGKSYVLSNLMNKLMLDHVVINCIECYSTRLLYNEILEKIIENCGLDDFSWKKCDNINDFVCYLKQLLEMKNNTYTFYLIIEKAERLRSMDAYLLPALLRLSELTKLNISLILVTEIAWQKFLCGTCFPEPVQVHFNDYSQNELIEVMSLDSPDGFTRDFFASYCRLLISVFQLACRDLNELRHLALLNFSKYCEPLQQDDSKDIRKLWRNIEPHLKKCLSTVYLREVSNSQWEEMKKQDLATIDKPKVSLELPYLSKYLVIAAYLASHNPSRTDRRFFCKRTYGKMSKRAKAAVKNAKTDDKLTGPKAFPLDRLLAIFYSIIDDDVDSNASLLTQVSTLVTLNLISKASADDQIDTAKYKCLVQLEFVQSVADNLDFNLTQYLFDQS